MATRIESTEITQPKKVFVKSEQALDEMEANGQLEPFTDYYTDDEQDAPFMPIGSIFASAIPQEDARVHLLDGSTISQTGVYETFVNLIKALDAAGNNIAYKTNDEFNADVSTYGQCGKFVIDNDAGTIRLPLITEFIASNNGGQTIGLAQLDMFKSHEHGMDVKPAQYTGNWTNGHYSGGYVPKQREGNYYDGSGTTHTGGEETRPKNIRYPYYIVLASGYKSSQIVDIDNVMNEVNLKASKDKINTNMLGVPSNNNWIDISWSGETTVYTAPANGYIVAYFESTTNADAYKGVRMFNAGNNNFPSGEFSSVIKGGNTCFIYHGISAGDFVTSIPVKKGDNIRIIWQNVFRNALRFVPAEEV